LPRKASAALMKKRTMETVDIRKLLRQWFESELAAAPAEDPRRTAQCLRFADVSAFAHDESQASPTQKAHVEQCAWCKRAVSLARHLIAVPQSTPGSLIDTAPTTHWSDQLRAQIAAREKVPADESASQERQAEA
jgi:hypothetical protein